MELRYVPIGLLCLLVLQGCSNGPVVSPAQGHNRDGAEGVMRFFASDSGALVRCGVSIAALAQLEDDALAGPQAMVITYHRNRALIQEIVERKY
jgi:hypothetical protein